MVVYNEIIGIDFSQGSDHLTLTWKVTDSVHSHIDVKEQGKENAFSLGAQLIIGNEVKKINFPNS